MDFIVTLQRCLGAGWSPRIGDPGLTGWLTVAAYGLCAVLAVMVVRRRPRVAGRGFWVLIALMMAALGINKQLDLQSALTATGRCAAKAQGWYDGRQTVQTAFIAVLAVLALIAFLAAMRALRGSLRPNAAALIGATLVGAYVMIRAVGFHHVDRVIGQDFGHLRVNFLLETTGLVLIALNAAALLWMRGRGRARR